jgi:hypothetical protein
MDKITDFPEHVSAAQGYRGSPLIAKQRILFPEGFEDFACMRDQPPCN